MKRYTFAAYAGLFAMLGLLFVAQANAAVNYEPAPRKCYAILNALGSKPVEVPCDSVKPSEPVKELDPVQVEPTPPTTEPVPSCPPHQRHRRHRHKLFQRNDDI